MPENDNAPSTTYDLISADNPASILDALVALGVVPASESITKIGKAGEGNMNLVLRVTTDSRSVIIKQARPWVEKYPGIPAPDERILAEVDFYRCTRDDAAVSAVMPGVLASSEAQRLLVLEDLGAASDYAALYSTDVERSEVDSVFELAIDWVTQLHSCDVQREANIGCKPLRVLNHQHIFLIPLSDPPQADLDAVCDGLANASRGLCNDDTVQKAMAQLGEHYLSDGGKLLHGDYYPGSWLKTDSGFRVIDPEFCFCGPREFDLGVLAAHWIFCGGEADNSMIERVCDASGTESDEASRKLVAGFAGAELIRRLIGVAQLPLDANLQQRTQWMDCGVDFLKQSIG